MNVTPKTNKIYKINNNIKRKKTNKHSKNELVEKISIDGERTMWTHQQEQLLISWAEKSSGYSWLHNKCINFYKTRNRIISIPASIFGYISGTATLLTSGTHNYTGLTATIGICGILAGILSNLQQMFTYKELSEQHRISSLRFQSFFRDISCELSLNPKYRSSPIDYIKMKRLEFDKMLEQSPDIPDVIIDKFHLLFKDKNIHKPENTNTLQTIRTYDEQLRQLNISFDIGIDNINCEYNNDICNNNICNDDICNNNIKTETQKKTNFYKTKKHDEGGGTIEIANSSIGRDAIINIEIDNRSSTSAARYNLEQNKNDTFMSLVDLNSKNIIIDN